MWLIRAALRRPITVVVAVIAVALTAEQTIASRHRRGTVRRRLGRGALGMSASHAQRMPRRFKGQMRRNTRPTMSFFRMKWDGKYRESLEFGRLSPST